MRGVRSWLGSWFTRVDTSSTAAQAALPQSFDIFSHEERVSRSALVLGAERFVGSATVRLSLDTQAGCREGTCRERSPRLQMLREL